FDLNSEIYIAYNTYKSAVVQIPKIYRLYPVPEELETKKEPSDLILEPDAGTLVKELLYHYLEVRFYQIILDSQIGELSARLMVLKGAVDNSRDLIDELNISLNKARQAAITRELMEIISSAEALKVEYEG
ncbi:MAG: F0F1 ATP synthase subunit gamma, partial [Candidatus Saganbacteria bacterium]|nr:F0F1 ATP synthase subunit gamma [Candidatus Saganbacteria bacterium]